LKDLREPRPYQVFYDEKYFTRDAPQPAPQQQRQQQQLVPPRDQRPPRSPKLGSATQFGDLAVPLGSLKDEKKKKRDWFKKF
jgi:hypothetical protein